MTAGASTGLPFPLAPVTVVTGHYGAGKTNFALNLALDAAAAGYRATLADMDIVNPYFRSNEYRDLLEGAGVRLIAPVFGHTGTNLDVPSVTGELAVAAAEAYRDETGRTVVIVDAGGDDVGATALARFAPALAAGPYAMLYVVNRLPQPHAGTCRCGGGAARDRGQEPLGGHGRGGQLPPAGRH